MVKRLTMLFATLAATGAGYTAGVLLAPKSGKETRQEIRLKTLHMAKIAKIRIENAKAAAHRLSRQLYAASKLWLGRYAPGG